MTKVDWPEQQARGAALGVAGHGHAGAPCSGRLIRGSVSAELVVILEVVVILERVERSFEAALPYLRGPRLVHVGRELVDGEARASRFDERVQHVLLAWIVVVVAALVEQAKRDRARSGKANAEDTPAGSSDDRIVATTRRLHRRFSSGAVTCEALPTCL